MSYAIYRHKKLSSASSIAGSARHMSRARPTANADPEAGPNRIIVGSDDPAADVHALLPEEGERGEDGKLLRRSNSVLAIEVLLTASPEWWAASTEEQRQDWLKSTARWLAAEYGRENIAHLQLHQDETNPHLTGFIVPRDPEHGRLNARRWLGGKQLCSEQQTSYAAAVEHLGLRRGIEGSVAKHERVQRHYAQIKQGVKPHRIEPPRWRDLLNLKGYAERQTKAAREAAEPLAARAKTAASDRTAAKAAKATATKAQAQAKRAEARAQALDRKVEAGRKLAAEMRALRLDEVLLELGFQEPSKKDPTKWRADGFSITVKDNEKWFDHQAEQGGGGAIDLAMHAMDTDFQGALAWLANHFGGSAVRADITARTRKEATSEINAAQKHREPFTAPTPVEANWSNVRAFLVDRRGIPAATVDAMHDRGDIYADERRNAVFLTRDDQGRAVGAELKGTAGDFSGLALGSDKAEGGFRLGRLAARTVYLVESAIDALSLYVLRRRQGDEDIAVVSTAGAAYSAPLGMVRGMADGAERICAYDADKQGDRSAQSLERDGWTRLRPSRGKDWNDELREADRDEGAPAPDISPEPDVPGRSGPSGPSF